VLNSIKLTIRIAPVVELQFLSPLVMGLRGGRVNLLLMDCGSSTILRMVNEGTINRVVWPWDRFIDALLKRRLGSDVKDVG